MPKDVARTGVKVFVAGATGALGSALVPELVARKHLVVGLARSDANVAQLSAWGADARRADITDADALTRAMDGCEVVVRTATHIPKADWSAEEVRQNDRVRRDGTRALLDAAQRVGASFYVQESVAWSSATDPATASAFDAEQMAERASIPTATLRLGWLYGSASVQTRAFADLLRRGAFEVPARASALKSFLHVHDAGLAFARAIDADIPGVFEVADREPVPATTFFDAFADALGAPLPRRHDADPGFFGQEARADASRFEAASGWTPRYPTIREGLREVAHALRS